MQQRIPLGSLTYNPKKGETVQPIPGKLVPTAIIHEWQTGMVYRTIEDSEGILCEIRGVHKGREFRILEYSDNIEEKP